MYNKSSYVKRPYPTLYHLSFNSQIEGIWVPKPPDGDGVVSDDPNLFAEPGDARISLSPTLEQCFQAVYANVKHLFEQSPDGKLTFSIYTPKFTGKERIVTPDTLTKERMVHDAHITGEHCVLDPLMMVWSGQVIVDKPSDSKKIHYYAFGKKAKTYYGWVPGDIRLKRLPVKSKPPISNNW